MIEVLLRILMFLLTVSTHCQHCWPGELLTSPTSVTSEEVRICAYLRNNCNKCYLNDNLTDLSLFNVSLSRSGLNVTLYHFHFIAHRGVYNLLCHRYLNIIKYQNHPLPVLKLVTSNLFHIQVVSSFIYLAQGPYV